MPLFTRPAGPAEDDERADEPPPSARARRALRRRTRQARQPPLPAAARARRSRRGRADFVARHLVAWHLADVRSWPSIEQHDLPSAAEIFRRWQVLLDQADRLLANRRPDAVCLDHPVLGRAVLRDQRPLQEHLVVACRQQRRRLGYHVVHRFSVPHRRRPA